MKKIFLVVPAVLAVASVARAQGASYDVVDAKITSAIADKEAADTKDSFSTGDKAWVWLKLKPNNDAAMLAIRWSVNGEPIWTMDAKPVKLGRTWYNKSLDVPGTWKAEILDGEAVLKELSFTVTGEPIYAPAPTAEGAAAAPEAGASAHFDVVEIKLTTEVKDREAVAAASAFNSGDKVYAWMKLNVKDPETQYKLRWVTGGAGDGWTSDPVVVKQASGWRTWSYKTMTAAGAWRVEVLDAEDKVVHVESFTVN